MFSDDIICASNDYGETLDFISLNTLTLIRRIQLEKPIHEILYLGTDKLIYKPQKTET